MSTLNCINDITVQSLGDNDAVKKMLKYFNTYLYSFSCKQCHILRLRFLNYKVHLRHILEKV